MSVSVFDISSKINITLSDLSFAVLPTARITIPCPFGYSFVLTQTQCIFLQPIFEDFWKRLFFGIACVFNGAFRISFSQSIGRLVVWLVGWWLTNDANESTYTHAHWALNPQCSSSLIFSPMTPLFSIYFFLCMILFVIYVQLPIRGLNRQKTVLIWMR